MKFMKFVKYMSLLLASVLMLACAALLVACGKPASSGCTDHKWDSGKYDVAPICGSGVTSTKTYTCRLCGEVMKKTVQAAEKHSIEQVIVKTATCTEDGAKKSVCKTCGFARDGEISIPSRGGHQWNIRGAVVEGNEKVFSCFNCDEKERTEAVVYYSDFGVFGDGVHDDADAIRAAHDYANQWGLDVKGEAGKTYYIGVLYKSITVQTNTDWCGAKFIIDDSQIPLVYDPNQADGSKWTYHYNTRTVNIFSVTRDADGIQKNLYVPSGMTLKAGQTNIGMTFEKPVMLKIENNNVKINIRYGDNANNGENQHEMILVDEQGNVDPTTPIQYDYDAVTAITMYSIDDAPITLKNAEFLTIAPNPAKAYAEAIAKNAFPDGVDVKYINNYCYFNRGFGITRSNVTISGINHKKMGEFYNKAENSGLALKDEHLAVDYTEYPGAYDKTKDKYYTLGVPYAGFFTPTNAYNFTLKDTQLHGHKEYSFIMASGSRNAMGSYELNGKDSIKVTYDNLYQPGDITDRANLHGVMGTNYIRNMTVKNSHFDRIDVHQGAHNMTVKNCTLGLSILIIGGGTLYVEDVEAIGTYGGGSFIILRGDYNSVFDGDVIVKNVKLCNAITNLIGGTYVPQHYSGLPNYMTRSLTVENLQTEFTGTFSFYKVSNAFASSSTNPLYVPEKITVKNVTGCAAYRASANGDLFADVPIIEK